MKFNKNFGSEISVFDGLFIIFFIVGFILLLWLLFLDKEIIEFVFFLDN